jgi:hypothetical protein
MLNNAQFVLSNTTATKIVEPSTLPQKVYLHNMSKSSNNYIHIGNDSVGTANSLHLDPGESITLQLMPLDDLWAISDPNGLKIGVLTVGQNNG